MATTVMMSMMQMMQTMSMTQMTQMMAMMETTETMAMTEMMEMTVQKFRVSMELSCASGQLVTIWSEGPGPIDYTLCWLYCWVMCYLFGDALVCQGVLDWCWGCWVRFALVPVEGGWYGFCAGGQGYKSWALL